MANLTYNRYWKEFNSEFEELGQYENPVDSLLAKDKDTAFQNMATLYVKYIQLFRKLEDSYDELLHPQKRRLMKDALTATMGRLLEIKHTLVDLECSDYFYFNDILLDLSLTPDRLKIPIPRHLFEERKETIKQQRELLESFQAKDFLFGSQYSHFQELSIADAVKMLQRNERGRQGNQRAKYMREIKLQAQREKEMISGGGNHPEESEKAVRVIQRVWRGYKARKLVAVMRKEELIFLGMDMAPVDPKTDQNVKQKTNRDRRKVLQQQFEDDYLQALVATKEKILRMEGPDIKEAIQDDFRQWYMEYKRINGKFPEFPAEEDWKKPDFKFTVEEKKQEVEPVAEKDKKAEKKPEKKAEKKPEKGKKKGEETADEDPLLKFNFGQSEFLKQVEKQKVAYEEQWKSKDESENFAQRHDQEIIKADKRREVESEIKNDVFEILQDELKNLILAVEKEKGKKGKKGKGAKGKKGKKDKGKKGKKEKDMTANRTMESLVEELVKAGILQKYTPISLDSVIGNFSLFETSVSKSPVITPTIAEVQRVLTEYCILPFGVPVSVEPEAPPIKYPKVASILLFGPSGVGKTMMVQAIASEMGAQIFNLSPRNTAGQFVGKPNVTKMLHMVFKVARAQSPAIIYIDGAEMIFAKKVPKDDTSDPKRIKKDLAKSMKLIKDHAEKVILIATSNKPWEGDAKAMLPLFDKVLYVPSPDYSSRHLMWKEFIARTAPEAVSSINISLLTRMSDGFSTGTIDMICSRVLTPRRIRHFRTRPLNTLEFIEQILDQPPLNPEIPKMFQEYCEKLSLAKKRASMLNGPEEDPEAAKKAPPKKK